MQLSELLTLHEEQCGLARGIIAAKNADYTAGSHDIFANFRSSEALGVPAVLSILVRMLDKMQRIRSFEELGELQVKSESVDDAIQDLINYSILAQGLLREQKES